MRILLLTQYFAPEPAAKFTELARDLGTRGHQVQVLTSFPCYPHGRTYEGYRQAFSRQEIIDGNLVTRVAQFPDHSRSVFKRALYYFSFALSAATIGLIQTKRADVIYVYQSALPTGLAAWVISRVKRMPYVLDVVDLWPESVAATGILHNRLLLWLIRAVAKFIYKRADRIHVITKGYRQNLIAMGVAPEKIRVLYHWPSSGCAAPAPRDEQLARQEGFHGRFNIFYAGQVGPCQQLQTVLKAAELLKDLPKVQFVIAGSGVDYASLEQQATTLQLENVRFLGRRPPHEIAKMYALSEMLLVHLKPDPMSRVSIPSKTFSYMAAGRPLLMAIEGEAGEMIQRHQCGTTVKPSEPVALADAVRKHYTETPETRQTYGDAARKAYLENYCKEVLIPKVENSLLQVTELQKSKCDSRQKKNRYEISPLTSFYTRHGKRAFDLLVAVPVLIFTAPLMAVVAILVKIKLGSPVLYSQRRPGLHGSIFSIRKFRTMTNARNNAGELLPDEIRLTKFGRWLRKTSLDELPQLISVLRGDMSLVGPRPLLEEYLKHYSPDQAKRHEVKPGMTGLAQVRGRNAIDWEKKFEWDIQYVRRLSFFLDLKIIAWTISSLVRRSNVSAPGHATMPKYMGKTKPNETQHRRAA